MDALCKSLGAVCVVLLGLACGSAAHIVAKPVCSAVAAGDTVIFSYRQAVKLFGCDQDLSASIDQVTDTRCPKNVQCVWAGTAQVMLRFNNEFTVALEIGKKKEASYFEHSYALTLVDAIPYPQAGTVAVVTDSKAIVRVVRID